jgi:hypothetical protein
MKYAILLISVLLLPSTSYGVVYFEEDFSGAFPYSWDGYLFGYSNSPIETFHDTEGGVDNSGNHRIPLGGPSRTNFDVHFSKNLPNLSEYYVRYYVYVNPGFDNEGENWKLTYNYTPQWTNWVFWFRSTWDGNGFQPAFYSTAHNSDLLKTESVPTFYLRDFKGQWICFEYYANLNTNTIRLWITTEDQRYNETLYIDYNEFNFGGSSINLLKVGAYWDGTGDDNFFRLDDVIVSDQYNGPILNPLAPSQPGAVNAQ